MSDEPIGTITIEGRELPLLEIARFMAGDPPVEYTDVRTPEGHRRFIGTEIEHVRFDRGGTSDAPPGPDGA